MKILEIISNMVLLQIVKSRPLNVIRHNLSTWHAHEFSIIESLF
jgi:hypothetical protein